MPTASYWPIPGSVGEATGAKSSCAKLRAGEAAKSVGAPDAAERLADLVLKIAEPA
jgi:hypothetical protein